MLAAVVAALSLLALDGASPDEGEPDLVHDLVASDPDCRLSTVDCRLSAAPAPTPTVLYLNFSDGTERIAHAPVDRAMENLSIIGGADPYPEFRWEAFLSAGATREDVVSAVAARVHEAFLPYDLVVSTRRPAMGPYSMVMIGGAPAVFRLPADVAGIASMDCGNRSASNVVFAFPAVLRGSQHGLFVTIAQEAAHGYGLEHTTNMRDLMYPRVLPQQASFPDEDQPVSGDPLCGAVIQNSHSVLLSLLGPWTGGEKPLVSGPPPDQGPPTVSFEEPAPGALVAPELVVRVLAEDDLGVDRVVLEAAGDSATLNAPPFEWHLDAMPPGPLVLTATAFDRAGQSAAATVEVTVDGAGGAPGDGGCAAAGTPPRGPAALALALLSVLACASRRRQL